MKVEIITHTPEPELVIEQAARTCYDSGDKICQGSAERIIKSCIKRGHLSVLEHASATFRISGISRVTSHQLVRHRLASFCQQSQRYVNQADNYMIIPESIANNDNAFDFINGWENSAKEAYSELIKLGIPQEDARFILPEGMATEIVMTMNFRELRTFLTLRLDKKAQWEIRQLAEKILDELVKIAPNCFNDLKEVA